MLFINIKLKFETRTLDFHQLIIIIFKVKQDRLLPRIIKYRDYKQDRLLPRIIKYRDYKNFQRKAFNNKLQVSLKNFDVNNSIFIELKATFMEFFIKVTLLKTRYLKANYS